MKAWSALSQKSRKCKTTGRAGDRVHNSYEKVFRESRRLGTAPNMILDVAGGRRTLECLVTASTGVATGSGIGMRGGEFFEQRRLQQPWYDALGRGLAVRE